MAWPHTPDARCAGLGLDSQCIRRIHHRLRLLRLLIGVQRIHWNWPDTAADQLRISSSSTAIPKAVEHVAAAHKIV
jgi:hypothetical protein